MSAGSGGGDGRYSIPHFLQRGGRGAQRGDGRPARPPGSTAVVTRRQSPRALRALHRPLQQRDTRPRPEGRWHRQVPALPAVLRRLPRPHLRSARPILPGVSAAKSKVGDRAVAHCGGKAGWFEANVAKVLGDGTHGVVGDSAPHAHEWRLPFYSPAYPHLVLWRPARQCAGAEPQAQGGRKGEVELIRLRHCDAPNLTALSIPSAVTSVADSAFRGNSTLRTVNIPTSVSEFPGCGRVARTAAERCVRRQTATPANPLRRHTRPPAQPTVRPRPSRYGASGCSPSWGAASSLRSPSHRPSLKSTTTPSEPAAPCAV